MLKVVGQLTEFEIFGDTLHAPWLGHSLKGAQQHLTCIFLVVSAGVVVPIDRQIRRDCIMRFGEHVKVFTGMQRYVDTNLGCKRPGPHATGQNNEVRRNIACVGSDTNSLAIVNQDFLDFDVFEDLCATHARALG